MSIRPKDPLLLAGKAMALVVQVVMVIGALGIAIGLPALIAYRERAEAVFSKEVDAAGQLPFFEIVGVMLLMLAVLALLFLFFGRLRRIIATVGEGDPFQPENADRLSQMGWLMVAVHLLLIPAAALGYQIIKAAEKVRDVNVNGDGAIDFGGILLIIILFILARVFRHGTAMREDLEGTV